MEPKYDFDQIVYWITDMGAGVKAIYRGVIKGIKHDALMNFTYLVQDCWMNSQEVMESKIFDNRSQAIESFMMSE